MLSLTAHASAATGSYSIYQPHTYPPIHGEGRSTLGHSISRNILERLVRVAGPLAPHLQHAFADDVALDLVRTSGDRAGRHRHQDLRQQPTHWAVVGGQLPIRSQQRGMHASCRPSDDAGRQLAEGALGALRPPLLLRRSGAARGPFRGLRHRQHLGDLLPQNRIVDLPGRLRPLQDEIDAARTLRIPLVGLHRRADFLPLLLIDAARLVGGDCPAASASAPRRSCISVVVVTAQPLPTSETRNSGSTLASVKNTWLNEA